MKYLVNIDLSQNELQNAKIQNLATAPENPVKGQIYFNTASNAYFGYNGTKWVNLGYEHPSTHSISQISGLQSALDAKSDKTHNHDGVYKPASYVPAWSEVTGKPSTFTPSSHSHSEYVNKNAFANVKVGTTTVAADTVQDTLELAAGSNIILTPDATNDKITIAVNGLTVSQSEKDTWNAKETTSGAQSKANAALASAKSYTDTKVAALVDSAPEALDTLNELATAIGENQAGVTDLLNKVGTKAEKSYVDTELGKKANSSHTHTGAQVNLSGYAKASSVAALSTSDTVNVALGKLEKALDGKQAAGSYAASSHNHDSVYVKPTGTVVASRVAVFNDTTGRVIKDSGFTIATSVPSGAKFTDTVYTHPSSHAATMITQDETHRFVTDAEKATWNAKSNLALGTTSSTAFRGDQGLTAYNHSQTAHAPANAQKNSDITKAEIEAKLTGTITSHTHNYAASNHNHNGTYMRRYASNIGDGSATTIKVTHNLGSEDVTVAVKEVSTKQIVFADIQIVDSNSLNILFASAPTSGQYRVVVIG